MREIKEEAGIDINEDDLELIDAMVHPYLFQDILYSAVVLIYHIELPANTTFIPNDDIESIAWYNPKTFDFTKFWEPQLSVSLQTYLRSQNML